MLLPVRLDSEIRTLVRSGNVAYELVRPLDLYNFWDMRTIASCLAPTTLRSIPLLALALLVFALRRSPWPARAGEVELEHLAHPDCRRAGVHHT